MNIASNLPLIRLGEAMSRRLSLLMSYGFAREMIHVAELYSAFLAGKGSGQNWNIESEVKCACGYIRHARPIIFDVGANKGEWSEIMAEMLPDARLYLFEPQPKCLEILREKSIPNSILVPKGLSDRNGTTEFYTSTTLTNEASIHARRDSAFQDRKYEVTEIEITSVDQFALEEEIEFVDFMKMDVEGHEYQVLAGAERFLADGRVGALSFEFGSSNVNSRTFFHDFWDFLSGHRYKIGRILPSGRLLPIDQYSEDCEYFRGISNYIAYREIEGSG